VAFSIRGDVLASGGADRKIQIWRLGSAKLASGRNVALGDDSRPQ